jgi:hypothetical protein
MFGCTYMPTMVGNLVVAVECLKLAGHPLMRLACAIERDVRLRSIGSDRFCSVGDGQNGTPSFSRSQVAVAVGVITKF